MQSAFFLRGIRFRNQKNGASCMSRGGGGFRGFKQAHTRWMFFLVANFRFSHNSFGFESSRRRKGRKQENKPQPQRKALFLSVISGVSVIPSPGPSNSQSVLICPHNLPPHTRCQAVQFFRHHYSLRTHPHTPHTPHAHRHATTHTCLNATTHARNHAHKHAHT